MKSSIPNLVKDENLTGVRNLSVVSIYVSHYSEEYLNKFHCLHKAELGRKTYLINSSTSDIGIDEFPDIEIINIGKNVGFSAANNIGIEQGARLEPDYYLVINPDVLLPPLWMNGVLHVIKDLNNTDIGIFTVPLFGYDFDNDRSTGFIDSLGIDHTWYGRWFDISHGESVAVFDGKSMPYEVFSACGALMLIHKDVVCELLERDGFVFNESYFMYKEDIELSVRVRNLGKKIVMIPALPAFHCRGWEKKRADSPYWARKLSARNELKMHFKYFRRYLPFSLLKYLYVVSIERMFIKRTE